MLTNLIPSRDFAHTHTHTHTSLPFVYSYNDLETLWNNDGNARGHSVTFWSRSSGCNPDWSLSHCLMLLPVYGPPVACLESSWNVMAHGDAREEKWRGNWRMVWVASTLYTTSERCVSSITTVDAHSSAASSRLNWRPRRFKWTRPFRPERRSLVSARVASHFNWTVPSSAAAAGHISHRGVLCWSLHFFIGRPACLLPHGMYSYH